MTVTTLPPLTPSAPDEASPTRRRLVTVLLLLALLLGGGTTARILLTRSDDAAAAMPQSSEMESVHGVRFTRLAVVGDGGLLVLSYVVLDAEKASRLQADRDHPPVLSSGARAGGTKRVSLMRTGHLMRAGSTYYFVYQNTAGAIRSHELASVSYGGITLEHVPVL